VMSRLSESSSTCCASSNCCPFPMVHRTRIISCGGLLPLDKLADPKAEGAFLATVL
jgi:hypothetical protein